MSSSQETAFRIDRITDVYQYVNCLFVLVVGLISNVALIAMFTTLRVFRKNQCAFYLTVESIADIGLLLAFGPSGIASYIQQRIIARVYVAWCKMQLACSYCFGLCSFYTICFVAFDQYLSTNHRLGWRQKSTIHLAYYLTFFIVFVSVGHSVLFFIFAEIGKVGCSVYHPTARLYFTFFFYPILSGLLPILISISFSLMAYNNVRRIVRRQVTVVRRRLDRQMTALALTRVLCIIILGIPFIASSLYEFNFSSTDPVQIAIMRLVSAITYSTLYINYSINFYLFLIVSPRFRHQAKNFFFKKIWRFCKTGCCIKIPNAPNNRTAPEIVPEPVSNPEST